MAPVLLLMSALPVRRCRCVPEEAFDRRTHCRPGTHTEKRRQHAHGNSATDEIADPHGEPERHIGPTNDLVSDPLGGG